MSASANIHTAVPGRSPAPTRRARACAAARRRAQATGEPVLLRWLESSDIADPWLFAHSHALPGDPFWMARDGDRNATQVATGALQELRQDGPRRFSAAAELCSGVLEQSYDLSACSPPSVWPAAVGGFAFSPGPLAGPWQGWPAAWFFVPRALWLQEAGRSWIGVNVWVDEQSPDDLLARALERIMARPARRHSVAIEGGHPEETQAAFCERVANAVRLCGDDLEKVVLARALQVRSPERATLDVECTWQAAAERDPSAFAFALGHWGKDMFVGATPERLLEVEGRRIRTGALAGTAPRSPELREDRERAAALLASTKDRREHALVTASLEAALASECPKLRSEPLRIRSTPDVHHLETRIVAMQRNLGGLFAWAERLHPTPAVAGQPRAKALAHLLAHEPLERGYYAGAVGYATSAGDGALWVAIRSALLSDREAYLYAGAGIVPGSQPQAEWNETEHKLAGMRRALRASREEAR